MSRLKFAIAAILFFGLGVLGTLVFSAWRDNECQNRFKFINSYLICGRKDVIKKTGYITTRNAVAGFIDKEKAAGRTREIAVYFRDLMNGPVFGVNELASFAPASLLKLPIALVFMNSAETQPPLLEHKVRYVQEGSGNIENEQTFKPRVSAVPNTAYTIEELLKMMLIYSDNASYYVLEEFLTATPERHQLRWEAFQELGIVDPKNKVDDTVTVRNYAALFRVLYNASYLNVEGSEKMLGWLAKSDFDQGIKAGLPPDIEAAHKFGERFSDDGTKQLHDCGIVYYPANPYLLCIMTRGGDFEELAGIIKEISKMVYEEVDSRRLK